MEGEEDPTLEAEVRGQGRREKEALTIKMETDSDDSSQEEGEAQITIKKKSNKWGDPQDFEFRELFPSGQIFKSDAVLPT